MKYRGTLLLVLLTACLAGFYFLYQRPQAEAKKVAAEFEKRFFHADTNAITLLIIENRDGVVQISHGTDGWMIERPQRYRPDDGMIRKLLDTIATGQLTKVVGEAADLKQFGFDRPLLQLTLGVGNRRDLLLIGQINPTDTGYYAYSESLGKIFMVNKELPKELYLRLYDLREKRLYPAVRVEEIGRVVISRGKEPLDLSFNGKAWWMRAPFAMPVAAEEMKTFLDKLIGQKATAFIPWEQALIKLPQQVQLQLFDLNGRPVVDNKVYYLGTGENEGIVVHAAADGEAVRTSREFWELLQVDAADLMERRLFPHDPAGITRIRVVSGSEQIELERDGNRWQKNGSRVDRNKMPIILDTLRNWKTTKQVLMKESLGKTSAVIEVKDAGGVVRLTVSDKDLSRSMAAVLPTRNIENKELAYFLATSTILDRNVLIASHELEHFLKQIRQLK